MGLLDNLTGGGGRAEHGGGMSPMTMALMGLLAYRTLKGKGRLADMLGRTGLPSQPAGQEAQGGGLGGLLGGLIGSGAGGLLSGGLGDLLKRFQDAGHGDKAQSWVSTGPNHDVAPAELEQTLGEERIQWLMAQTGLSREDLLAGLSRQLPDFVDRLTPQGRLPTTDEAARMA